jgi:hypothetical protein
MPVTLEGCTYPTNLELRTISAELRPTFAENMLGMRLLPEYASNAAQIVIDQPDVIRGIQQYRGLDQPSVHTDAPFNPYGKRCVIPPSYWGEFEKLDEEFLTQGAQFGDQCLGPVDLSDQVMKRQLALLVRHYRRVETNIWRALIFGVYEAYNIEGQLVFQANYNTQVYDAAIPWSDRTNATPLADLRYIRSPLGLGTDADFGVGARYIMNQVTADCLFSNQNVRDIGKQQLSACCTYMGPEVVNQQFRAQGLGTIEVYNNGYPDVNRNFQLYIPDGYVVVIGPRTTGEPIGHYYYTRAVVGCGVTSGPWDMIIDTCGREVPRSIRVHRGHNGGPALEFPRSVIVLRTGCTP